jgi:hemin uptake protein HemP
MNPKKEEPPSKPKGLSRRIDSKSLFEGNKEVIIIHGEEEYQLRQTKNGRLLLTK